MREHLIVRSGPTVEPITLADAKLHVRQTGSFDDAAFAILIAGARQFAETVTRRALIAQRLSLLLDSFPRPGLNVGSANWYGPQWGINPGPMTVLSPDGFTGYEIFLPMPPTIAIEAIKYVDGSGAPQTLAANQYQLVPSEKALLVPAFGTVWPQTQDQKAAVEVQFIAGYAAPATADATADTLSAPLQPSLSVGSTLRVSNIGGALPAPLVAMTDYYVRSVVSSGVYTLSATSGGSLIDITTPGTGTTFIGVVPEGILSWMKLRIGTLDINREEVAILNRGKVELLPYVDGLLDPFRVLEF
jgi:hypothetical protein